MRVGVLMLLIVMGALLAAVPAHAASVCQHDDAITKPLPAALVPEAASAFGIHNADAGWVERSTVVRCMDGKLLACNMGANLPCGKANTATALPAGDD